MSSIVHGATGEAILLFAGLCAVLIGSFMVQKAWHRDRDAAEVAVATLVIAFAWIVVSSLALGIAGLIRLEYRMLADGLFLGFGLLSYAKYFPRKEHLERTSSQVALVPIALMGVFAASFAGMLWIWGWVSPPPAWDAFVYHLGFPAAWLQHGEIFPVTVPFGDQAGTYFPSNVELVYLWIMTYAGQDFATNTVQWLFMLMCTALVYRLCRIFAKSKSVALAAAFSVFFMPSIFHQAVSSEVDIAFAAMFLSALYFTLRWVEKPAIRFNFVLAMTSAGLFAGTKSIATVWTVFFLFPALVAALVSRGARPWMIVGLASGIATGGYWYIRNFIITGNPVFPLTISLGGLTIFPGAYTRATMLNSLFHTDSMTEWLRLLASDWGPVFLFVVAISTAATALSGKDATRRICFGLLPWMIALLCFLVIPYNREVRFTYTAFLLGSVAMGIQVDRLKDKRIHLGIYGLLVICIANLLVHRYIDWTPQLFHLQLVGHIKNLITAPHPVFEGMRGGALFFAGAFLVCGLPVMGSMLRQKWVAYANHTIALAGILTFAGILFTSANYPGYQYDYYSGTSMGKSWKYLHSEYTEPVRIAYTGTDLSYGLYGPHLKNSVYHVPVNRHGFRHFHDCNRYLHETGQYTVPSTDRIDFCRRYPDYSKWKDLLMEADTDLLYVSILHQNDAPHLVHDRQGFPIERYWAESHPEVFKPLDYNWKNPDGNVKIYSIRN